MKPAPEKDQLAAVARARATRRGGKATGSKGFYQVVVPPGFKRSDRAQQYDQMEINKGRVHAFVHDAAPYVFVEVRRRPRVKVAKGAALRDWSEAVLRKYEPLHDAVVTLNGLRGPAAFITSVPVYFADWRDRRGRRHMEYAYVPKGCDRSEIYEHFVEAGPGLMQVTVDINGAAAPAVAAPWLDAFFDAPLSTPAPPERRFAYGHSHQL